MNILPKKSWHVLNKKNIERVRRDEAQARAEEEEKAGRAALAEQESRMGAMRKRARERDGDDEDGEGGRWRREGGREGGSRKQKMECSVTDASGHINFFADLQKGVGLQVGNTEREKEMKQEQEKLEKRIGLLNYLVDKDKSDTVPWYARSGDASRRTGSKLDAVREVEAKRKSAKAEHRKELMDPLLDMQHYVKAKKKCSESYVQESAVKRGSHSHHRDRVLSDREPSTTSDRHSDRKQDHKQCHTEHDDKQQRRLKKHKKKKGKEKEREGKEEGEREGERKRGSDEELERLRRERRKREEGERAKAEALIRGLQGGRRERNESLAVEVVHGRYNSQFNPHLARQQ